MATLTIRNLPDDVRDALRREAAEHRRSMEEEARLALGERYRKRLSQEELRKRLEALQARFAHTVGKGMPASDMLIATRRVASLYENELITREEKAVWNERIDRNTVSLSDVEAFAAGKRQCRTDKP